MDCWKKCRLLNLEKELNSKREKLNRRQKEKDKKTYQRKTEKLKNYWKLHPKLKTLEIKEKLITTKKELINCSNNRKWKVDVRK
jgi:hypothetical protein